MCLYSRSCLPSPPHSHYLYLHSLLCSTSVSHSACLCLDSPWLTDSLTLRAITLTMILAFALSLAVCFWLYSAQCMPYHSLVITLIITIVLSLSLALLVLVLSIMLSLTPSPPHSVVLTLTIMFDLALSLTNSVYDCACAHHHACLSSSSHSLTYTLSVIALTIKNDRRGDRERVCLWWNRSR